MLLKSADDKSKRVALLEELQRSQLLDATQKKWLRDELMRLKRGMQGEREAAHYLDHYFKDGENHVVLHDLRFVIDGEVTQIDHLIINRTSHIFLLETKNYACNLVINDHGEFTAEYERSTFGVPSPIEQSRRHERSLVTLLERLDIVGRTQKQPDFHHVVLLHPKATIQRPSASVFDTSIVIKADQFPSWHQSFVKSIGIGGILKAGLNMRSLDTVKEWGEKLMRQHRPADQLALPDFMRPRESAKAATPTPAKVLPAQANSTNVQRPVGSAAPAEDPPAKKLICAHCGVKISFAEGKFCWNNEKRFGRLQYCREHQVLATPLDRHPEPFQSRSWLTRTQPPSCRKNHGNWTLDKGSGKAGFPLVLPNPLLVTGGSNDAPQRTSTELYDPANGTWSPVGDLKYKRDYHTAILLDDGRVLATGGDEYLGVRARGELFYPGN